MQMGDQIRMGVAVMMICKNARIKDLRPKI
jgi:hypothetical protein